MSKGSVGVISLAVLDSRGRVHPHCEIEKIIKEYISLVVK
jgi:hypothetical protein